MPSLAYFCFVDSCIFHFTYQISKHNWCVKGYMLLKRKKKVKEKVQRKTAEAKRKRERILDIKPSVTPSMGVGVYKICLLLLFMLVWHDKIFHWCLLCRYRIPTAFTTLGLSTVWLWETCVPSDLCPSTELMW